MIIVMFTNNTNKYWAAKIYLLWLYTLTSSVTRIKFGDAKLQ